MLGALGSWKALDLLLLGFRAGSGFRVPLSAQGLGPL